MFFGTQHSWAMVLQHGSQAVRLVSSSWIGRWKLKSGNEGGGPVVHWGKKHPAALEGSKVLCILSCDSWQ